MIADLFASLFRGRSGTMLAERPDALDDFWYRPVGSISSAGVTIRPDNALQISTVFACVRLLAETIGSLPWRIYRRQSDGSKQEAPEHKLWPLLHDKPNPYQTAMEWREMAVAHLLLRGNFYCRITGGGTGFLVPMNPDRVTPQLLGDGAIVYSHRREDGTEEQLDHGQVFHVRGLSLNGVSGVSAIEYARNACGLAIAQESHGAAMFKNGGLPTFWIERPPGKPWTPAAIANFRNEWRSLHAGAENAGNPPILADGMKLNELGLTNEDTQWIESRGFQAVEICRFFRCPPHMVGILDRATFSNIEQQSIEFVQYTIRPWAVRLEQTADEQLLEDDTPEAALGLTSRKDHFTKIALEGLLRGDVKSRYEAYNVGLQAGFLTRNEVRALEDLNPVEGGDTPLEPLNMVPGGSRESGRGGAPPPVPPERPSRGEPEEDEDDQPPPRSRGRNSRRNRNTPEESAAILDPLIQDAAARIGSAEIAHLTSRADKAIVDRTKWNKWLDGWYTKHAEYVAKTIGPLASAAVALQDADDDRITLDHQRIAWDICQDRCGQLRESPDPLALVESWRETIIATTASKLKGALYVG